MIKEGYQKHLYKVGTMRISDDFINKLGTIQETRAIKKLYRGVERCKFCDDVLYVHTCEYNGFLWKEGYIHYMTEHKVQPTDEFRKMIEEA